LLEPSLLHYLARVIVIVAEMIWKEDNNFDEFDDADDMNDEYIHASSLQGRRFEILTFPNFLNGVPDDVTETDRR
jgi:hypothetical protein